LRFGRLRKQTALLPFGNRTAEPCFLLILKAENGRAATSVLMRVAN
jgi:hypothetical protein